MTRRRRVILAVGKDREEIEALALSFHLDDRDLVNSGWYGQPILAHALQVKGNRLLDELLDFRS